MAPLGRQGLLSGWGTAGHGPRCVLFGLSLRHDLVTLPQSALNCVSDACSQPQLGSAQPESHTAPHGWRGTHPASQLGLVGMEDKAMG